MRVFTAPMRSKRFQQSFVSIFRCSYTLSTNGGQFLFYCCYTNIYIEYTQSLKLELANKTHAMQTQRDREK